MIDAIVYALGGVVEAPPLSTRGVDDPGELVLDKRNSL